MSHNSSRPISSRKEILQQELPTNALTRHLTHRPQPPSSTSHTNNPNFYPSHTQPLPTHDARSYHQNPNTSTVNFHHTLRDIQDTPPHSFPPPTMQQNHSVQPRRKYNASYKSFRQHHSQIPEQTATNYPQEMTHSQTWTMTPPHHPTLATPTSTKTQTTSDGRRVNFEHSKNMLNTLPPNKQQMAIRMPTVRYPPPTGLPG